MANRFVPASETDPEGLKILLVYENFATAKSAKRLCDQFAHAMVEDAPVHLNVWKFDFLDSPLIARAATRQAQEADLIVVAAENPDAPSKPLRTWLENLPPRRDDSPAAMVGFLAHGAGDAAQTPLGKAVRGAADRTRMDFLISSAGSALNKAAA